MQGCNILPKNGLSLISTYELDNLSPRGFDRGKLTDSLDSPCKLNRISKQIFPRLKIVQFSV